MSAARLARPSMRGKLDALFKTSADLPRLLEIDVAAIRPNPFQPRKTFDEAGIAELALSIERHGLLQPLVVQRDTEGEGGWVLLAGERRLRALRSLSRSTVPAIVSDGDPAEVALIENLQREGLDPLDEAAAIDGLMRGRGWTQSEVAQTLGRKQNTISQLLALNALPEPIRADYRDRQGIPRSLMIELAQIDDSGLQTVLWERIRDGGMTVRGFRAERETMARQAAAPPRRRPPGPGRSPQPPLAELAAGEARLSRDLARVTAHDLVEQPELRARLEALRLRLEELLDAGDRAGEVRAAPGAVRPPRRPRGIR